MTRALISVFAILCVALLCGAGVAQSPATPQTAPAQADTKPAPDAQAKPDVKLDADQIIENHIKASGGRAALAAIKDQTVKARLEVAGSEGTIELQQKAPNKVHRKVDVGGQTIEAWFDGEQGFNVNPFAGDGPFSKDETESTKASRLNGMLDYKEHGETARFVGVKKVGDKEFYEVELIDANKTKNMMLFDKEFNLVKVTRPMLESQGGGEMELEFADYREVEGTRQPFRLTQTTPQFTVDMFVESYKFNSGLDDEIFKKKP